MKPTPPQSCSPRVAAACASSFRSLPACATGACAFIPCRPGRASAPKRTAAWDGVGNYQARNMLRDSMKKGDLAFFYHSSCDVPGIAGIVSIVKEGYPDKTAFDPKDAHYDADSKPGDPRWYVVDV